MSRFHVYDPQQAYLLPPNVGDVLGTDHLCFFLHRLLKPVAMKHFYAAYANEGAPAYAPEMMLRVLLYAYALGITSMRRLEQRIREDLAFRYLACGQEPDFWALNQFRHPAGGLRATRPHQRRDREENPQRASLKTV